MEIDEDEYVDQFKPFLMDVVHEWCKGATFSKLCEMTDIFEGKKRQKILCSTFEFGFDKITIVNTNTDYLWS